MGVSRGRQQARQSVYSREKREDALQTRENSSALKHLKASHRKRNEHNLFCTSPRPDQARERVLSGDRFQFGIRKDFLTDRIVPLWNEWAVWRESERFVLVNM